MKKEKFIYLEDLRLAIKEIIYHAWHSKNCVFESDFVSVIDDYKLPEYSAYLTYILHLDLINDTRVNQIIDILNDCFPFLQVGWSVLPNNDDEKRPFTLQLVVDFISD